MEKIRIAVVDDHNLFRKGIIALLAQKNEFIVSFEAENGKVLIENLIKTPVDVILLDLDMPTMTGYEAIEIVKDKFPEIKVLVLTLHDDDVTIAKMIGKGANGFLAKDDSIDLVIKAIETVFEKDYFFTQKIIKVMEKMGDKSKPQSSSDKTITFTHREKEIIILICKEYSTKEIACKLNTSVRTVDWHRKNMYVKTNTKNSAGIVFFAVINRLIQ